MPAHNEAGYLEKAVREVDDGLRARDVDCELLVVENGSTDGTVDIARQLAGEYANVRVVSRPVANYGAALREGLTTSVGDVAFTFDVDCYTLDFVDQALALLEAGAHAPAIVVASKRAPGRVTRDRGCAASSRQSSVGCCGSGSRCPCRTPTG
jgi:dolichyl-phosphate beta-glucosyltransferase